MKSTNKAFTLVELMIVLSIIVILFALLLPGLKKSMHKAKQLKCQSQLKNLYTAVEIYAQEYDGIYPYIDNNQPDNAYVGIRHALGFFIDTNNDDIVKCTNGSSKTALDSYYYYNSLFNDDHPTNADMVAQETNTPPSKVYIFSCRSGFKDGSALEYYPHSHGVNVLYTDGHVTWERQ